MAEATAIRESIPTLNPIEQQKKNWNEIPAYLRPTLAIGLDAARAADALTPQHDANDTLAYRKEFEEVFSDKLSRAKDKGLDTKPLYDQDSQFSLSDPKSPTSQIYKYSQDNPNDQAFFDMLWDNLQ